MLFAGGMDMSSVNVLSESVIPMTEVQALLPWPMSLSTVKFWAKVGVKGVKLETARLGGRRLTSKEAVQRFLMRINDPQPAPARPARKVAMAIA